MIISPREIVRREIVTPVTEEQIQPNGIDLTLNKVKTLFGHGSILREGTHLPFYADVVPKKSTEVPITSNKSLIEALEDDNRVIYELVPNFAYQLEFNEAVSIPDNMSAHIHHRSSIVRSGGIIRSGWYDSGFKHSNIGCFISCHIPIFLEKGTRTAQIIFYSSESAHNYDGQFQGELGSE